MTGMPPTTNYFLMHHIRKPNCFLMHRITGMPPKANCFLMHRTTGTPPKPNCFLMHRITGTPPKTNCWPQVDSRSAPFVSRLAVLPLVLWGSGVRWWCVSGLIGFMLFFLMTAVAVQSGVAVVLALQALQVRRCCHCPLPRSTHTVSVCACCRSLVASACMAPVDCPTPGSPTPLSHPYYVNTSTLPHLP